MAMIRRRILYLGDGSVGTTSLQRRQALERIGHNVHHISTELFAPPTGRIHAKFNYWTGHRFRQQQFETRLRTLISGSKWDVAWVDSGWWCGEQIAQYLREQADAVVLVCCDDPFGVREPWHWASLRSAIRHFDLCVTFRQPTASDFHNHGVKNTLRLTFGYDEVAHLASQSSNISAESFHSEVAFIGSRMEDRHSFMIELLRRGVPLSIWGNGWKGGPGWRKLKHVWRGPGLVGGHYVAAIQRAKVCLGLLSKGNRDQHTQRTNEIPFAGGLLCAQRTPEHLQFYQDGIEAVFWNDVDECADVCVQLLNDPVRRAEIIAAGAKRVRQLGVGNEQLCATILNSLAASSADSKQSQQMVELSCRS